MEEVVSVFIQNSISQALEFHRREGSPAAKYFFLKDPKSLGVRREYEESNFLFLKEEIPGLTAIFPKDICQHLTKENILFSWDAYDEGQLAHHNGASIGPQNRLLDSFDLSKLTTFTPFRKIVEDQLGENYRFSANTYQFPDPLVKKELSYYFEENHHAQTYFETRNEVLGRDYSTKFSSLLSCGRLNVRYLYNYLKDYEGKYGANKSTYWISFEILWREFFYWSYQKNKEVYFSRNGLQGPKDYQRPAESLDYLSSFKNDPFMMAVSNELIQSGFISNRFRQVFASSLVHYYKFDWILGAQFFEHYLIDYDVYSNWGNWQYQAGVGHDPRGSRVFNVLKQLETYDPKYEYIKMWAGPSQDSEIKNALDLIYKKRPL